MRPAPPTTPRPLDAPAPNMTRAAPGMLLRQLEDAAYLRRATALGAPAGTWRGFAFRLDGRYLVAPMEAGSVAAAAGDGHSMNINESEHAHATSATDVGGGNFMHINEDEHATPPAMQIAAFNPAELRRIPHCHDWMRGITQIGGTIFSVIDFSHFLGFGATDAASAKLLLLPAAAPDDFDNKNAPENLFHSALLLAGEVSLRAFERALPEVRPDAASAPLAPYLRAALREGRRHWLVLDIAALLHSQRWIGVGR